MVVIIIVGNKGSDKKMRLPFYNFRRGMSNIIRWIPVIWGDEDFDYEPLYNLLYHKLKFMEEFYRSDYTWSAGALKTANEIKIAKNLAKRLTESNYLQNAFIEHKKIYPHYLEKGMHTEKNRRKTII